MKRAVWLFVALSLMFGSLAGTVSAQDNPEGVPKSGEAVTVSSVPNGGTLVVILGDGSTRNVGLIGVSAPSVPTATDPGQCYGEEARLYLESLAIPGSIVYLEADSGVKETDETLLRHVWVVPADGGKALLANTKMVRDGYADVGQGGSDSKYAGRLADGETKAKKGKRGAWAVCGEIHKQNPQTPEQVKAQYEPVDIRDVSVRPGNYFDRKIFFTGLVNQIQVAQPGYGYYVGSDGDRMFSTSIIVTVQAIDGSYVPISIGYDGDTSGIFEDSYINVYGTVFGVDSVVNVYGRSENCPALEAAIIEIA